MDKQTKENSPDNIIGAEKQEKLFPAPAGDLFNPGINEADHKNIDQQRKSCRQSPKEKIKSIFH